MNVTSFHGFFVWCREEHKKYLEDCAYVKKVDEKGVEGLSVEDMIDINEARYISLLVCSELKNVPFVHSALSLLLQNFNQQNYQNSISKPYFIIQLNSSIYLSSLITYY